VPETKGRSLEKMDEIFGSAYEGEVEVDLRDLRRKLRGRRKEGESGVKEQKVVSGDDILRVEKGVEV